MTSSENGPADPVRLTADRYRRHALVGWLSQEELKRTRVALVGAGAVGNEVLKDLALLGVGGVDVFDLDRVELHNLTRSVLFREDDVGRWKAEVAAERARALDPSVDVRPFTGDFWDLLRLSDLPRYRCVVGAVDSYHARVRLNTLCLLARVDLVDAGVDARHVQVSSFPFSRGLECACYECHLPPSAYQRMRERYSCGWLRRRAFVERVVPTTAVTSSMAGALAVSLALGLGGAPPALARRVLLDTATGLSTVSDLPRNPACAACAGLDAEPRILPVAARVGPSVLGPDALSRDAAVSLSEPVVFRTRCLSCDGGTAPWTPLFRRASDLDDSLATCPACGEPSVAVDLRDQTTPGELVSLAGDSPLPCKYLSVVLGGRTTILEPEVPCPARPK